MYIELTNTTFNLFDKKPSFAAHQSYTKRKQRALPQYYEETKQKLFKFINCFFYIFI